MSFTSAGQLARPTPTVRPEDPLGLVAENLRSAPYSAIPVLDRVIVSDGTPGAAAEPGARILGLVDERDLNRAVLPILARAEARRQAPQHTPLYASETVLAGPPLPPAIETTMAEAPEYSGANGVNGYSVNGSMNSHAVAAAEPEKRLEDLTARDVMRADISFVPAAFSLHNALLTLDRYNSLALPVVDETGSFRGMISRADVVAALGQYVRPPMVGGMATPLGVWLTTGRISAGAPGLGLFLSGLVMSFCFLLVHLVMLLGLTAVNKEWALLFYSGRLGAQTDNGDGLNLVITLVHSLLFLICFRLLPMAGTHAAEHQTVWAIERGLPLVPEVVEKMPRAHPRCGTNLVALSGLIVIIFQHLPVLNANTILFALLFVYLTWRNFGELLQNWFTTRPATRRQLESGIRAGCSLIEKYQQQPHISVSFGTSLFNSGLALSVLGMVSGIVLIGTAMTVAEAWILRSVFNL